MKSDRAKAEILIVEIVYVEIYNVENVNIRKLVSNRLPNDNVFLDVSFHASYIKGHVYCTRGIKLSNRILYLSTICLLWLLCLCY